MKLLRIRVGFLCVIQALVGGNKPIPAIFVEGKELYIIIRFLFKSQWSFLLFYKYNNIMVCPQTARTKVLILECQGGIFSHETRDCFAG